MWAPILLGVMCLASIGLFCAGGGVWLNSILDQDSPNDKVVFSPSLTMTAGVVLAFAHIGSTLFSAAFHSLCRRAPILGRAHELGLHLLLSFTILNAGSWLDILMGSVDVLLVADAPYVEINNLSYYQKRCAAGVLGLVGSLLLLIVNGGSTLRARYSCSNGDQSSYNMNSPLIQK